jgi:hypothetical protein
MTSHQFQVDQTVYLRRSTSTHNAAAGASEITALLPEVDDKSLIELNASYQSRN